MTQEELSPNIAYNTAPVKEAEVLMCELYEPLQSKCYARFSVLRHLRFTFILSATVKSIWDCFKPAVRIRTAHRRTVGL
jgi:hypothetical protein